MSLLGNLVSQVARSAMDPEDRHWQLLMRSSRGDNLWQAELVAVSSYSWVICFKFIVKEPYQRPLAVAIFRDQVSAEQWRKLSILANSVSAKTT